MFWLLISRLNTKTPPGSHPIPTDLQVASPPSQCFIWPILGLGHPMNSPAGYRDGPKHRRQPPAKLLSGNNRGTPNHLLCHSPTREHGGGGIAVLRSGSRHSKGRERRYRLGFDTGSLLLTLCYISCGVCSNSLTGLNHCKCRRDRVWCVVNPVCWSDCRPVLTRCLRVATRLGLGRHIETLLLNEKSTLLKVCGDPRAPNWPATR